MPRRPGFGRASEGLKGPEQVAEEGKRLRVQLASFISASILKQSVCPDWERRGSSFQVLEWSGDAVLHLFLTQQVLQLFSAAGATEGQMSSVRGNCGSTVCLAKVFKSLDLARLLHHPGGPDSAPNYLVEEKKCADVVEAILGELFEYTKEEADGPSAAKAATGTTAREVLYAFMDFIFRLGIQDCPQRVRPLVGQKLWLLCMSPEEEEGAAAGRGGEAAGATQPASASTATAADPSTSGSSGGGAAASTAGAGAVAAGAGAGGEGSDAAGTTQPAAEPIGATDAADVGVADGSADASAGAAVGSAAEAGGGTGAGAPEGGSHGDAAAATGGSASPAASAAAAAAAEGPAAAAGGGPGAAGADAEG